MTETSSGDGQGRPLQPAPVLGANRFGVNACHDCDPGGRCKSNQFPWLSSIVRCRWAHDRSLYLDSSRILIPIINDDLILSMINLINSNEEKKLLHFILLCTCSPS